MNKYEILQQLTFGQRVAEDEGDELANYFVETDQWRRIFAGQVDIVYGPKGSGKSAIYSLLLSRQDELDSEGVLVTPAENPRGTPIFKDLVDNPPTTETEFVGLWKLYFLSLIGDVLQKQSAASVSAKRIIDALEKANLLKKDKSLRVLLSSVYEYVRGFFRPEAIEGQFQIDPVTGVPTGLTGKITFREPSASVAGQGYISVDSLIEIADSALNDLGLKVWILLDRLDVAFVETTQLEENALRALFKVYLDLLRINNLRLKIFLRTDIWTRLTTQGFREASHITRHITMKWDDASLLNLVTRRILQHEVICNFYSVEPQEVLQSAEQQSNLFYRIFPRQVDVGQNNPLTFKWMLGRTKDGTGYTAPRELIHLLNSTRDVQIARLERGDNEPEGESLFVRTSMKDAMGEVSTVRLEQTLYAEYPNLRELLQKLTGEKTQQTPRTLATIWGLSEEEAAKHADQLYEIGFFEKRGKKTAPIYWVPFLYRDALKLVQGTAE